MQGKKEPPPFKDRIITWYFVMAFAVVFAVNGVFVYLAISTNTGVVTENPYEKGLDYDHTLELARKSEALGWQTELAYRQQELAFQPKDAEGKPLSGAEVTAYIARPVEAGEVVKVPLAEAGKGRYAAELNFPAKGQWDITVNTLWNKQYHQIRKRLVVE